MTNGVEVHIPDFEEGFETMLGAIPNETSPNPDTDVFISPAPKSRAMPPPAIATEPEKGKIQVRIKPYSM